jgi:CHASE3 domain sensor protein
MSPTPTAPLIARPAESRVPRWISLAMVAALFVGISVVTYWKTRTLRESADWVSHSHRVLGELENVLSLMKDAESGQRGFIITGDERYLEPYNAALRQIDAQVAQLGELISDNAAQTGRLQILKNHIRDRRDELAHVITLRREQGVEGAKNRILSDRGRTIMELVRQDAALMRNEELGLLSRRFQESDQAFRGAIRSTIGAGILGVFLTGILATLMERSSRMRVRHDWLKAGQTQLGERLMGEQKLDELGRNALTFLSDYLGAKAGAVYVADGNTFRLSSTYALPPTAKVVERFTLGEGLLGQAAKDARPFHLRDVPEGYLTIGSGLGQERPRHLLIAPAKADGVVNAVVELGFFRPLDEDAIELMARCSEIIGVAARSAQSRSRILELLEETQRQAEELQTQSEELRVSNEELEEQSRALQQTQTRLEQQQADLEETNM